MVFVAELDRLAARDPNLRYIGGTVNRGESGYEDDDDTNAPNTLTLEMVFVLR